MLESGYVAMVEPIAKTSLLSGHKLYAKTIVR